MQKLTNQSDKFRLNKAVTYLNGAYMSPQLKSVSEAGLKAIGVKEDPTSIQVSDFFETQDLIRSEFSKMINNYDPQRIVLIPSVSYGMSNVINNMDLKGGKVIIAAEQFPSNVYPWMRAAREQNGSLEIVSPPIETLERGEKWNEKILNAIDSNTAAVALSHVHWADGTKFDLVKIRERTREVGSLLIIDGTQSVGAMPFDVAKIQPDALICAGYKWLLGPYGLGVAYFSESFDGGVPIEENWINRLNSEDFAGLVDFEDEYQPGALRYGMGEQSQFVLAPMLLEALKQINDWHPARIQDYCDSIITGSIEKLRNHGYWIEDKKYRASHLFGIRHESISIDRIKSQLTKAKIFVSYRGTSVRVSPYVHNTNEQIEYLVDELIKIQ